MTAKFDPRLVAIARERAFWLGGAQWSGKTTVAQLLAVRYGLIHYAYDYHDARSHAERSLKEPERFPNRAALLKRLETNADSVWVDPTPKEMAAEALKSFEERFVMVLEDLASLPGTSPVIAEGWGLRPEFVATVIDDPRRAVFLVPSKEFRERQIANLPRAGQFNTPGVSNIALAQANRLERDHLLAIDLVESAERHGLRVIEVDGSLNAERIATIVAGHFGPLLPEWLYRPLI